MLTSCILLCIVSLWPARHGKMSTAQLLFDGATILPADNYFIVIGIFSSFFCFFHFLYSPSLLFSLVRSLSILFSSFRCPSLFIVSANMLAFNAYSNGIKLIQTTAIAEIPCNSIVKWSSSLDEKRTRHHGKR